VGTDKLLISSYSGAHLFSLNGTLLTDFTNNIDYFGYGLAAVGSDKVLIGAVGKTVGSATNAGAAYLFGTNGGLLMTFTNPSPELYEEFGNALTAVGPDKVLIAAHYDNLGAAGAGAAYLFSTNGTLLTTFANPTPAVGDQFGHAVAAVGPDKVLISAIVDDTGATNTGAVYLFSTTGTLLTTFTNPTPAELDFFGYSIAAVGTDKVLISAALGSASVTNSGVVYLYSTNGARLVTFVSPTPASGEVFGYNVSWMSPDKVLIGAGGHGNGAGTAYLFSTNETLLATLVKPNPVSGDYFGCSVASLSDRIVVGAYGDNTSAPGAGAVYVFGTSGPFVPGLISQGVFDGSITASSLANATIDSSKIVDGSIAEVDLANGAVSDQKISSVDASKLTGIVQDARLSGNVAFLYADQTFTGQNTLNNAANSFSGDGAGLTALNASSLSTGTVADARLSGNVALRSANQTFTGQNTLNNAANSFTGSGAGLTGLNASSVSSGTLADTRLSANVALLNANQTFTGSNTFNTNVTINPPGAISFGGSTRQMLNLYGAAYGIGVQPYTFYFRADSADGGADFTWYKGGVHSQTHNDPGSGGALLMRLANNGQLFTAGAVNPPSDRNQKENFAEVNARVVWRRSPHSPSARGTIRMTRPAGTLVPSHKTSTPPSTSAQTTNTSPLWTQTASRWRRFRD
jgi:hypothetical protein